MNLIGKDVLITRPRVQAEEFASALIAEGAQPVFFPVIQITPLLDLCNMRKCLSLQSYAWT